MAREVRLYDRISKVTITFAGGDSKIISGLRTTFSVTKAFTRPSQPNKISVSVYNLAEETRNRIRQEGDKFILEVGYSALGTAGAVRVVDGVRIFEQGFLEVLAVGDLTFSDSVKQGPDWITTIDSGDGDKAHRLAQINESFGQDTGMPEVITKLVDKIKEFTDGQANESILFTILENIRNATNDPEVEGEETDGIIQNGMSLAGSAAEALDEIVDTLGLEWSVQDGVTTVLEVAADNGQPALLLTPTSGLIGSPVRLENGNVGFNSLILPGIKPGRRVTIQSQQIEGDYKVIKADFSGDTHGQDWNVQGEAKLL